MLKILILKEFKNILLSPKFAATFLTASLLILLSVYVGLTEYNVKRSQYETGLKMASQRLSERTQWSGASTEVFREPNPMQIFVSGVSNDIGRFSTIDDYDQVKLRKSMYSDDPVFAVFRLIDLAFVIQVVLSLLAILFTYDAINGERENGTLKLVLANSIPRWKYLLAKFSGAWLGLIAPLTVPILVSFLLLMLYNIPLAGIGGKLAAFLLMGLLYYTFFIGAGLMVSTLTRHSSTSFLLLLVFWVCLVLIVPRMGTMAAGQLVKTTSQSELDSQVERFSNQQWQKHEIYLRDVWQKRNDEVNALAEDERQNYRDEKSWQWMEEDDAARKTMQREISDYGKKIKEEMVNRKAQQETVGFNISRISPAATFILAAMNLADTDVHLKNRTEKKMEDYKTSFNRFVEKKNEESGGGSGGIQITMDSESGLTIKMADMKQTIDLNDLPRYLDKPRNLEKILEQTIIDFGILLVMSLLVLGSAFAAFVRYDVR